MRMSQDEKDKSHARIVASASRLMRERGLEGASVAEVMKAAGMTHGGFYKHFESKEALAEAAIDAAFAEFVEMLDVGDPREAIDAYRALYLSDDHLQNPGFGCPVATVAQEIARAPAGMKAAFGAGVRRLASRLARTMRGPAKTREAAAFRQFSLMVGALVIARASDPDTARIVLDAARWRSEHVD